MIQLKEPNLNSKQLNQVKNFIYFWATSAKSVFCLHTNKQREKTDCSNQSLFDWKPFIAVKLKNGFV